MKEKIIGGFALGWGLIVEYRAMKILGSPENTAYRSGVLLSAAFGVLLACFGAYTLIKAFKGPKNDGQA